MSYDILKDAAYWDAIALEELSPGSTFIVYEGGIRFVEEKTEAGELTGNIIFENFVWENNLRPHPTKEEIQTKVTELKSKYNSTEYQRLRSPEYPPLADLADALYWQAQGDNTKMTVYLAAVDAVKTKYPKGAE